MQNFGINMVNKKQSVDREMGLAELSGMYATKN